MKFMPIEQAPLITSLTISEGRGAGEYEVRLMKDENSSWISPERARDLWHVSRDHDVLFSDYTKGKAESFLRALAKENSIWFEVSKDGEPVGILYMSRVIPHFDGTGHFSIWDKVGSGREPLVLDTLDYMMREYDLHRVTAEIPAYQKGTIRFVKRLGFQQEGIRREGVPYKGEWVDQHIFGILKSELINVEVEQFPEELVANG